MGLNYYSKKASAIAKIGSTTNPCFEITWIHVLPIQPKAWKSMNRKLQCTPDCLLSLDGLKESLEISFAE